MYTFRKRENRCILKLLKHFIISQEHSGLVSGSLLPSEKLEIFSFGDIQSFCVHACGQKVLLFLSYPLSTLFFRLVLLWIGWGKFIAGKKLVILLCWSEFFKWSVFTNPQEIWNTSEAFKSVSLSHGSIIQHMITKYNHEYDHEHWHSLSQAFHPHCWCI